MTGNNKMENTPKQKHFLFVPLDFLVNGHRKDGERPAVNEQINKNNKNNDSKEPTLTISNESDG